MHKGRAFDEEGLRRARDEELAEVARSFRVASPEDTVLAKLEWLRAGGETSERQWADVVGLRTRGPGGLDTQSLARWASAIDVAGLLERARRQAGGTEPA